MMISSPSVSKFSPTEVIPEISREIAQSPVSHPLSPMPEPVGVVMAVMSPDPLPAAVNTSPSADELTATTCPAVPKALRAYR